MALNLSYVKEVIFIFTQNAMLPRKEQESLLCKSLLVFWLTELTEKLGCVYPAVASKQ